MSKRQAAYVALCLAVAGLFLVWVWVSPGPQTTLAQSPIPTPTFTPQPGPPPPPSGYDPYLLKDLCPGNNSSYPGPFTAFDGRLFFAADCRADPALPDREPWVTDGTPGGTMQLKEIWPGGIGSDPRDFSAFNGRVFFSADDGTHGRELWATDGTPEGTVLFTDIQPGSVGSYPSELAAFDGWLFFRADDGTHGQELWATDGTPAGTVLVADIWTGSFGSDPQDLVVFDGRLFFRAYDGTHGRELWVTDGTPAGTTLLKDIKPGSQGSLVGVFESAVFDGRLFFSANDGTHGYELWVTDGTPAGTTLLKDIQPGSQGSFWGVFASAVFDGRLFFSADDGTHGQELWVTDGTPDGTALIEIYPGLAGSYPSGFAAFDDRLFFRAEYFTSGTELWLTDGTAAGTILVEDINPGSQESSYPKHLTLLGEQLLFSAYDAHGVELWAMGPSQPPPTATDDSYTTDEDLALVVGSPGVLANDSDPNGDPLTAVLNSPPSHGSLSLSADGAFTYSPDADYCGPDGFTYNAYDGLAYSSNATVGLDIICAPDAPLAAYDAFSTQRDTPLAVGAPGVLANDTDPDGDPLAAVLDAPPSHGSLTLGADGSLEYVPSPDYCGADSFTYHATDGQLDSNVAAVSVNCVNNSPLAADDSYTTDEDTPLAVGAPGVLDNDTDPDGDPLTAVLDAPPSHGSVTLSGDGAFTYTPGPNYCGWDSFTYHTTDGLADSEVATASLYVVCVNDAPQAGDDAYTTDEDTLFFPWPWLGVLANDTDPDGDPLAAVLDAPPSHGSLALGGDGWFTYSASAGFCGSDGFAYHATDGQFDSNIATVTLSVLCVNDAPQAGDDAYTADEDTSLVAGAPGVLDNDTDPDGDPLTAVLDSSPAHGALAFPGDGAFTYTPDANYCGPDSFTYHAHDGQAESDIATVDLEVTCVDDPPALSVDVASQAAQYSDQIAPVTVTATDPDSSGLSISHDAPSALTVSGGCTPDGSGGTSCSWTLAGQVLVPVTTYNIAFLVSDAATDVPAYTQLAVRPEHAILAFDGANPVAVPVAEPGGDSGPFSLQLSVSETTPDQPASRAAPGDIALASLSLELVPIGPGSSVVGACAPTGLSGTGYDALLTVECAIEAVPVNTYALVASVGGGYYAGLGEDVLTVYDPSLGFTTGGGWFAWPGTGDRTNLGYTMKYNKKGTQIQGSLLLIRHLPDGSIYRLKSNVIDGLALGDEGDYGWATFTGRATYREPGWPEPLGNYSFVVYVEDHGEPGAGADRVWLEVYDRDGILVAALSMAQPPEDHAAPLGGGNLVVPYSGQGGPP